MAYEVDHNIDFVILLGGNECSPVGSFPKSSEWNENEMATVRITSKAIKGVSVAFDPHNIERVSTAWKQSKPFVKYPYKIASSLYKAVEGTVNYIIKRMAIAPQIVYDIKNFIDLHPNIKKVFGAVKFSYLLTAPFDLYAIAKNARAMMTKDTETAIDAALELTCNLASLGETTSHVAKVLADASVVAETAVTWATPMLGVSALLSVASIGINYRAIAQAKKLLGNYNTHLPDREDLIKLGHYTDGITFMSQQPKSILRHHFHVKGDKLATHLGTIARKAYETGNEQQAKTVFGALNGRVEANIRSRKVSILSRVISIIGVLILFTSPVAFVGYVIFAAVALMSFGQFIYDWKADTLFQKAIGYDTWDPAKLKMD